MKRKVSLLLTVLLLICTCFSGCGEYTQGITPNWGGGSSAGGTNGDAFHENDFTVTLTYDGAVYAPGIEIDALWSDGYSIHRGRIGTDGVASVKGLDGDYKVTLSAIPDGFTYNPNAYVATNDNRHIQIELRKIKATRGKGDDLYNCININGTGVYRTPEIESETDVVYYMFTPTRNGMYSIESWIDITANDVNPKLDIYRGSFAAKYFDETRDGGGASNTYTKNFLYEVQITEDMVGNSFTIGVKVVSKNGKYPRTVDFAIMLDGDFERESSLSEYVIPSEDFAGKRQKFGARYNYHEYGSGYMLVGPEIPDGKGDYKFDGTMYGLNEEDGWYHLYNQASGKYDGPILYAHISSVCRFFDNPFTTIEYRGNKALTLDGIDENGNAKETRDNFKFFIEGWGAKSMGAFCVRDAFGNVYCPCLNECGGMCSIECTKCHAQCNKVPQAILHSQGGYADHVNSDGLYPVTAELKDFLQRYSCSQLLFFDGNGYVEIGEPHIDSKESDQWLFACMYYKAV